MVLQVLALLFNYVQLVGFDGRMLVWTPLVWCLAVWLPAVGWSASCLYLARKPRRQSFGAEGGPAMRYGQEAGGEYMQVSEGPAVWRPWPDPGSGWDLC